MSKQLTTPQVVPKEPQKKETCCTSEGYFSVGWSWCIVTTCLLSSFRAGAARSQVCDLFTRQQDDGGVYRISAAGNLADMVGSSDDNLELRLRLHTRALQRDGAKKELAL